MSVNKDFIIYSLMECPYCFRAKALIIDKKYEFVEFVMNPDSYLVKDTLKKNISNMVNVDVKTFPIIFTTKMEFIGGYDDLEHHLHKLSLLELNDNGNK